MGGGSGDTKESVVGVNELARLVLFRKGGVRKDSAGDEDRDMSEWLTGRGKCGWTEWIWGSYM